MFLLIHKDEPVDFWSNNTGDEFIDNTILKLKLDASATELIFYEGIADAPKSYYYNPETKEVSSLKSMTITDAEGNTSTVDEVDQVYEGVVFFDKGNKIHFC